jgi:hypothetical protein
MRIGDSMQIKIKRRPSRRIPDSPVRLPLRTLRQACGFTRKSVDAAMGAQWAGLLETGKAVDLRIEVLRRYLGAIGLTLELVAVSRLGHRIAIVMP